MSLTRRALALFIVILAAAAQAFAGERIPQSVTIRRVLKAYLSSDHVSKATGVTIAITISKNGGAFANPSAGATNATEIANGWYYVDLSTTDTNTTGPLIVRGTSATIDDAEPDPYDVVDPNTGGLSALPAVASGGTGAVALNNGTVGSVTGAVGSVTSGVTVTTNNDKTGYSLTVAPPTSAAIATAVWQDSTGSDFTTASSIGKSLYTTGAVPGAANGLMIAGSNAATTFSTLTSTGAFTVNGISNVSQTGDSYARIGAAGTGLTGVTGVTLAASQPGVTIPTVTTVTNQLTAAQVATGVWQDSTAGDFTTVSSIGKGLYTSGVVPGAANGLFIAGADAATTVNFTGNLSGSVGSVTGAVGSISGVTFPSHFGSTLITAAGNVGIDWGNVANPTTTVTLTNTTISAGSNPTAGQIATAVWQDATAGDFTVASSIGKSLYTSGVVPGAANGLFISGTNAATTVNFTGNLSGSVGSVTGAITLPGIPANWITAAGINAAALNGKGDWLLSSGYTVPPTAAAVQAAVFSGLIDNTYTLQQYVSLMGGTLAGAVTGGPTNPAFKRLDGAKTVVTGTVDTSGNRSAMTLNP